MGRLLDKVVIITGGACGIGQAYGLGMAREGAKIVVADIDYDAAENTAKEIQAQGGEAIALKADVSKVTDTEEMAAKTTERFGKIDVLINNAAILGRVRVTRKPFYELDLKEWDFVMDVNLKGTLLCCRAVYPHMKANGSGKIINITTQGFYFGNPNYVHYVASKAGVIALTRCMARELGDFNINVNCIAPGATISEDPGDKAAMEQRVKRLTDILLPRRCLKRMQYPDDLVGTAIFLASSDSDFITGQTIIVDGGDAMI